MCVVIITLLPATVCPGAEIGKTGVPRGPQVQRAASVTVREVEALDMAEAIAKEEAHRRSRGETAATDGEPAGWFSLGRLFGRKPRPVTGAASEVVGPGTVGEPAALPLTAPSPLPAPAGSGAEDGDRELSEMLLGDAGSLAEKGDTGGAIAVLGALLEKAPDFAEAWGARAKLLLAKQEYARAVEDYRKALAIEGGDIESHYGMGTALEKWAEKIEAEGGGGGASEKYRDAALEYKAVLWRRPDYPPACYSLGCVYARMGKKDDALYYFRKTLERAEKDSDLARRARYNMKLLGEY